MNDEIIKVHLDNPDSDKESDITSVQLLNGGVVSIELIISYIDSGTKFFYTTASKAIADVEVVRPEGKMPYIRTMHDGTLDDNLLSLPRF
ncbi:hypothetical protein BGL34_03740 [Fructilactobacillus lindneri]|nr:DUF3892 domain-containing protein [Fructilactobacillus lindneri]POH06402.1 hypothetical protein BGL35_03315 [Fructilactobacillus lindneri]POH06999.1 hypothetical protein BGL34_03740 [Fructilactobacillus lindneri]POH23942.1 hypothetical protein BHU33_03315 [Fructilactobacillus lindneri DSM 20690 = JCM 11027]SJZ86234.1 Protein of unknown function [Fructilactobacillus lindneri DSM 20690 = JCM 11027]